MAITDTLEFNSMPDGRRVKLAMPFSADGVTVPAGFVTDFATIRPRILWPILPPWGRYSPAAVIHDWLYLNNGGRTRKAVDDLFLAHMTELGALRWQRTIIYLGIRLGGWVAWW